MSGYKAASVEDNLSEWEAKEIFTDLKSETGSKVYNGGVSL